MSQRGKFTKIWIGGYHLTTRLKDVKPSATYDEIEAGGYTQDKLYMRGRAEAAMVLDGYFNQATGSTHEALRSVGTDGDVIATLALGNNATPAIGDMTVSLVSEQFTYQVNSDLSGVIAAHADMKSKGVSLEYGVLLADATITASGQQSSVNNTAGSSAGGAGYFHILGLSTGDTITAIIQHSTNDSSWSTLLTFTLDGSAIGAQRVTVSGTVNQYVRLSYTVTGSGVSFPIAAAFVRN